MPNAVIRGKTLHHLPTIIVFTIFSFLVETAKVCSLLELGQESNEVWSLRLLVILQRKEI